MTSLSDLMDGPPTYKREIIPVSRLKDARLTKHGHAKSKGTTQAQKKGLSYQCKIQNIVKKAKLGTTYCDQWILYEDKTGYHLAQPDIFVRRKDGSILLFEVKLTQTGVATLQMDKIYEPLLEFIFKPDYITNIQVCENLRYTPKRLLTSISQVRSLKSPGEYTWHCPNPRN